MKHFLEISQLSKAEVGQILSKAQELKAEWSAGGNKPILKGKVLGMVFQKPSLRTRVSFDMAMLHLGGNALYLSPAEIGLGGRESVPDVARVLSRYVDAIMARVFAHQHILQLAEFSRVPVINGLSEYNHPCQAMADFLTIIEKKGDPVGLKLAFIGDGNNVATSLLALAAQLGTNFSIATPTGYELPEAAISRARETAQRAGNHIDIQVTHEAKEAVADADVIYTDVWTSMGQEEEKASRLKVFPPFQINNALLKHAKADAIVMHCLPAHRGEEITDEVADGPQSVLFDQAENRMHAQKGILAVLLA